jgi:CcmD family protein
MSEFLSSHALEVALVGALGCWAGIFAYLWRLDRTLKLLEQKMEQQD